MPAPPSSPADSHRGLILPSSPASLGDRPACGEPSPPECRHSPAQYSPREPGGAAAHRGRPWPNSSPGASRRRGPPPGQPRGRLRARSSSTERSMGALRPPQHGSARLPVRSRSRAALGGARSTAAQRCDELLSCVCRVGVGTTGSWKSSFWKTLKE